MSPRGMSDRWRRWQEIVDRYELWSFYRFLRDAEGAGLTHDQARLLGTAGSGRRPGTAFSAWPAGDAASGADHRGQHPVFRREGISALADGFWSHRTTDPTGRSASLEQVNGGAPRPAVTTVDVDVNADRGAVVHSADGHSQPVAAVVFTPQLHLLETDIELRSIGSRRSPLGTRMWRAVRRLTYRQSSKTALVVREPFWQGTTLDGVTLTDRLPRASYTLEYGPPRAPGGRSAVIDLSFAWGQDADEGRRLPARRTRTAVRAGSVPTSTPTSPNNCADRRARPKRSPSPGRTNRTSAACAALPRRANTPTSAICSAIS